MNDVLLPQVKTTGEVAELELSTRESNTFRATVNVRLSLPRRTLVVHFPNGDRETLPQSPTDDSGIPVIQIPLSLN